MLPKGSRLVLYIIFLLCQYEPASGETASGQKEWFFPENPFSLEFSLNLFPNTFTAIDLRTEYRLGAKIPFGFYISAGPYFIPFPIHSTLYSVSERKDVYLNFQGGVFVNYPLRFLRYFVFEPQIEGAILFDFNKGSIKNPVYNIDTSYTVFYPYLQATFHPSLEWNIGSMFKPRFLHRFVFNIDAFIPIAHPLIIYDRFRYGLNLKVQIVSPELHK